MSETIITESDTKPCLIGQRVILEGLRSMHYNGKAGTIISMPRSKQDGRYGVLIDGSTAPITVRPENISLSKKYIIPQENHVNPNYAIRAEEGSYLDTDDLCHLKLMMNLFMTDDMQKKVYGRRISTMPNFCREIKSSGFPFGVDVGWAEKYLQQNFEKSRALPQSLELAFRCSDYEPDPIDIINRLGNADEKKLQWYFGERDKSTKIFPARDVEPYASKVRNSFSDQCYRKEDLKWGTTHVAVGFVDLGILLSANLHDPPSDSRVGPLRFIGVEKSPYAVAKSLVLWEMMKDIPVGKENSQKFGYLPAIRSILQVWFSATWDHPTEGFVRRALVSIRSSSAWESLHPSVQTILNHWEEAPTVSVCDARRSVINESTSCNCSFIPNMCREKDRLALSNYELTRDFCIYSRPYCGNLLMFSCPDGTLPLNREETIFSAFNFNDVMQILVKRVKAGCEISTIIDAAERYALSEILKLVTWVQNDQITLNLICGDIRDMVESVASEEPWSMSWSNVPDYLDYRDFHNIAKSCSVDGETIHSGYSSNWHQDVFGTSIIDYQGRDQVEFRTAIINTANDAVTMCYRMSGWDKFLRIPPPRNPINTTGVFGLEVLHFEEWSEYFFGIVKEGAKCNIVDVEHNFGSPLSPSHSSTIAFCWKYES